MFLNDNTKTMFFEEVHLFCGSGAAAFGKQQSRGEYKGFKGSFSIVCGFDNDPYCCMDFERLTGRPALNTDLFSKEQYIDFHGEEPNPEWHELTPGEFKALIMKHNNGRVPDGFFLSPPCKGFSGLLPEEVSKSKKYQALNGLVVRAMWLIMEAFGDEIAYIMIENVPRITSRGAMLLNQVKGYLKQFGYLFHEGTHDCGELGGLGQIRKRYLLIARNPKKIPNFFFQPPKQKHKTIGDILGSIPMPGDMARCGKMHRIPNLHWKTWERLALIPAGQDWRALNNLNYSPRSGAFRIIPWDEISTTVTAATKGPGSSNGVSAVADPRLEFVQGYGNKYRVTKDDEPSHTVTGSRLGSGAMIYADPKVPKFTANANKVMPWDEPAGVVSGGAGVSNGGIIVQDPRFEKEYFNSSYKVTEWEKTAGTVTSGGSPSSGAKAVADPRLPQRDKRYPGLYKVVKWEETSPTVIGQTDIQTGALNVADPRVKCESRPNLFGVAEWDKPVITVTGSAHVSSSNGVAAVQDPRIGCSPRNGTYGVQEWNKPGKTIVASSDVHAGAAAVADPRIPEPNDKGVYIIIAEDGTWHRPITTFEMAMLQGCPATFADGTPFELSGNSDSIWREHIGNMVPPPSSCAIGNAQLETLMPNYLGETFWGFSDLAIWVKSKIQEAWRFLS